MSETDSLFADGAPKGASDRLRAHPDSSWDVVRVTSTLTSPTLRRVDIGDVDEAGMLAILATIRANVDIDTLFLRDGAPVTRAFLVGLQPISHLRTFGYEGAKGGAAASESLNSALWAYLGRAAGLTAVVTDTASFQILDGVARSATVASLTVDARGRTGDERVVLNPTLLFSLSQSSALTTLVLLRVNVLESEAAAFGRVVARLTDLRLSDGSLTQAMSAALAASIADPGGRLARLDLAECDFQPASAGVTIAVAIGQSTNLRSVSLRVHAEYARALADSLGANRTITSVELIAVSGRSFWPQDVDTFIDMLSRALDGPVQVALDGPVKPTRDLFTLDFSELGDDHGVALGKLLRACRSFAIVRFIGSDLGDLTAASLADIIADPKSRLLTRHLDLSHNTIGDDGAARLAVALASKSNVSISDLDISHNLDVGNEGGRAFVDAAIAGVGTLQRMSSRNTGISIAVRDDIEAALQTSLLASSVSGR